MLQMRAMKRYANRLYARLEDGLDACPDRPKLRWITENKTRILEKAGQLAKKIPVIRLPEGAEAPRVFELARLLTEQADGVVDEDVAALARGFSLTQAEYDCFPAALETQLLRLIEKIVSAPEEWEIYAENTVKSLLTLEEIPFDTLRETCLLQEKTLLKARDYADSDEPTRARFRRKIAEIAGRTGEDEITLTEEAVNFPGTSLSETLFLSDTFLLSKGLKTKKPALSTYLTMIFGFSVLILAALWLIPGAWLLKFPLLLAALPPVMTAVTTRWHRALLAAHPAQRPFRLKSECAKEHPNVTVLTVLLSDETSVLRAVKTLEEHYAGNRIGSFLLLGDLKESDREEQPEDEPLLTLCRREIDRLNEQNGGVFAAIIRKRVQRDGRFSGRERKRGAIEDLVTYLVSGQGDFRLMINEAALKNRETVLTLDEDTRMAPGTAEKLICTLAHPANARYGLVQPAVGGLSEQKTAFQKIMAPTGGMDAYSSVLGEVNQDVFGAGTFCGKGIFSAAAYDRSVKGHIRENTVLSHDLLEGELLHTLYAGDVRFTDTFPSDPTAFFLRQERWVRGDWMLLPALISDLPALSKWKIFYNLIQSLMPVGAFGLLILAPFFGLWGAAIMALTLLIYLLPPLSDSARALKLLHKQQLYADLRPWRVTGWKQAGLSLIFLPVSAVINFTAAVKGVWRRCVSHKNVLEWRTSASGNPQRASWSVYGPACMLAAGWFMLCLITRFARIPAFLLTALWLASPLIAGVLGREETKNVKTLSEEEQRDLRLLAVRTALFFEDALRENDGLMPDNFQVEPFLGFAKRTSPTDLGFGLMSVCAEGELGLLSPAGALDRWEKQLEEHGRLAHGHGHLYNWYDLAHENRPGHYLSAVDSGNYAACLLTVCGVCRHLLSWQTDMDPTRASELLEAQEDTFPEDFRLQLREYRKRLGENRGEKTETILRDFLADGTLANCEELAGVRQLIEDRMKHSRALRFSHALLEKININREYSLRPLKEFLSSFPYTVEETLAMTDFDERLNACVWSLGREQYADLLEEIRREFQKIVTYAFSIKERAEKLEALCRNRLEAMDFSLLYRPDRGLLAIGYDDRTGKKNGAYDLLCSEARLTSMTAIALGKLPAEHWFRLGRPFTRLYDEPLCLSWSGTAFEYLMPEIWIRPPKNTITDTAARLAVKAQIGKNEELWGVSEAAYALVDARGEYQYQAFGLRTLALSPQTEDGVIAPYASLLALEREPQKVMKNLRALVKIGAAQQYGFFEAVDNRGAGSVTVKTLMAHHQGMILCSLTNFLTGGALRDAFREDPGVRAAEILLEEKMPLGVVKIKRNLPEKTPIPSPETFRRELLAPEKQTEENVCLQNGDLRLTASSRGRVFLYDGAAAVGELFFYLQTEKTVSVPFLPCRDGSARYTAILKPDAVTYVREDRGAKTSVTLTVSAEGDALLITAQTDGTAKKEQTGALTVLLKPMLTERRAYEAHPVYQGLFMEAEEKDGRLLMTHRLTNLTLGLSAVEGAARFGDNAMSVIGRSRDESCPLLEAESVKRYPIYPVAAATLPLTGTIRQAIFCLASGKGAERVNETLDRFRYRAAVRLARETARIRSEAMLGHRGLLPDQWHMTLKLRTMIENNARLEPATAARELFWRFGLDDEKPLMTVIVSEALSKEQLVRWLRTAAELWRQGDDFSCLLIEDTPGDYRNIAYDETEALLNKLPKNGCVRHVRAENVPMEERDLLIKMSFLFLAAGVEKSAEEKPPLPEKKVTRLPDPYERAVVDLPDGLWDNGCGRFLKNGSEYLVYEHTPVPWSTVLANKRMGTLLTDAGGGFTWADNACLNKLSPWSNDPVGDPAREILYLRDNKLGAFWSITAHPADDGRPRTTVFAADTVTYGFVGWGMKQKQTVFLHPEKAIKVFDVSLEGAAGRDLTAFFAFDPVMGQDKRRSSRFLTVETVENVPMLKRENAYLFLYARSARYGKSRSAFLGAGTWEQPQAVKEGEPAEEAGEPMLSLCLPAGERFTVFMGYAEDRDEAVRLLHVCCQADPDRWLEETRARREEQGRIRVETPDEKLNVLMNEWLPRQIRAFRLDGRCGFYQAGGAYGFRDQLQDVLALLPTEPERVREQLLLCAAHQFAEGDVQHWWHPPYHGVRTHVSDDLLFLPYVTAAYAEATGDESILEESVPFLEGHKPVDWADLYEEAWPSEESGTLREHCLRAIRLVMRRQGENGLPLLLSGDWNDGLNTLASGGKGESVWLGWFLFTVISGFLPYVDEPEKTAMKEYAGGLARTLNTVGWDGRWYRRASDDTGHWWGSHTDRTLKIDLISQAWSVLSGAGDKEKCRQAVYEARRQLTDGSVGIVRLLDPPLDGSEKAGYIGKYIPGVRENGGQYTHGAVWLAEALLQLGDGDGAYELLEMMNPITHTATKALTTSYALEPFWMPADIYANPEHPGRGGWSGYTGSAALYYRTVLSDLLGIRWHRGEITVSPVIPARWKEYAVTVEKDGHCWDIRVRNPEGKSTGTASVTKVEKEHKTEIRVVM